jgi:CarD family transcriptional regulator
MVVLALADGLTVTLPIGRAHEGLRPLASESDMRRVQEALREVHVLSADPWLKRRNGARTKLTGGDPVGLAELVRDSARRERALSFKGANSQLSPGEHELAEKARQLLSAEIALARGLGLAEADAWIDEQLTEAS